MDKFKHIYMMITPVTTGLAALALIATVFVFYYFLPEKMETGDEGFAFIILFYPNLLLFIFFVLANIVLSIVYFIKIHRRPTKYSTKYARIILLINVLLIPSWILLIGLVGYIRFTLLS